MASKKGTSDRKRLHVLIRKRENERKRLEKLKSDPLFAAELKEKEHLKYLKKKAAGKIKSVSELSPRDQRIQRKRWKINQRNSRAKKKNIAEHCESYLTEDIVSVEHEEIQWSQPSTSKECSSQKSQKNSLATRQNLRKDNKVVKTTLVESKLLQETQKIPKTNSDGRKKVGRRRVRRDRAKSARELEKLKKELLRARRTSEKYKKKFYRLRDKYSSQESPGRKIRNISKKINATPEVKKKLLFGEILTKELANGYSNLKQEKAKQIFKGIMQGDLFKKYKLVSEAKKFLPSKMHITHKIKEFYGLKYGRKQRTGFVVTNLLRNKVVEFLEDDANSRMCPGKTDCLTKCKTKQQKRYLNDTLLNIHKKFINLYPEHSISYTSFTRLKPFWIVAPKVSERDTCLCVIHSNMDMLATKLFQLGIVPHKRVDKLVDLICCEKKRECLQRSCTKCRNLSIQYNEFDGNLECSFTQWKTDLVFYTDKKSRKEKACRKTTKLKQTATAQMLVQEFEKQLPKFMYHVGNQYHQYNAIKQLKDNLKQHEIIIHVDFSENYICKYAQEVQSVHFVGGQQITLHTGVLYFKNMDGNKESKSFCTASESLRHDAAAIWAHLHPIINQHLKEYPSVTTIHGLSDSPSSQYRNKSMFFIFRTILQEDFPNIKELTWNYTESGHGKGAPDGVGGLLKRSADRLVAQGNDIENFSKLMKFLKAEVKGVSIHIVDPEIINSIDLRCNKIEKPFPGTMRVHQVSWTSQKPQTLNFRRLSCFVCKDFCKHFTITETKKKTDQENRGVDKEEKMKTGDWVCVSYDGELYPGEIIKVTDDGEYEVEAMENAGDKFFKWPAKRDLCLYRSEDIRAKISEPIPYGSRSRANKFYFADFPHKKFLK